MCKWQTGATKQNDNCATGNKRNPRCSQQQIYSKAAPISVSSKPDQPADHLHISTREGEEKGHISYKLSKNDRPAMLLHELQYI